VSLTVLFFCWLVFCSKLQTAAQGLLSSLWSPSWRSVALDHYNTQFKDSNEFMWFLQHWSYYVTNGLFLIPLCRERLTTSCPLVSPPALPVETTHGKLASWPSTKTLLKLHSSQHASAELCAIAKRPQDMTFRSSLRVRVRAGHALQLLEWRESSEARREDACRAGINV